jgi:parvulin-like peptidyl-prolyl isomerase
MDTCLDALIGLAAAPAAHQFHLQVVQGIDVGETVANGARQCLVVGQALLVTRNARQRIDSAVPLGFYGAEDAPAQACIADQIGVARGQVQVALGRG